MQHALPDLFPPDVFTWANFIWAVGLWYSYAFSIDFGEDDTETCLVPLISMLNHSPYSHISRYGAVADGHLSFQVFRPCPQGTQLYLSYGSRPNHKLFMFYGFTIPRNPHDSLDIELDFTGPLDSVGQKRERVLTACGGTRTGFLAAGGVIPARLVLTVLVACAEPNHLKQIKTLLETRGRVGGANPNPNPLWSQWWCDALAVLESMLGDLAQPYLEEGESKSETVGEIDMDMDQDQGQDQDQDQDQDVWRELCRNYRENTLDFFELARTRVRELRQEAILRMDKR